MLRCPYWSKSSLPLVLGIFVLGSLLGACQCDSAPADKKAKKKTDGGPQVTADSGLLDAIVGSPDANNPNNDQLDSDCDGLSDAEEFGTLWPSGLATDPAVSDSDGDGLRDGLEAGRTSSVDPRCQGRFSGDTDAATITDPTSADSDGDGLLDGAEDANHNGRFDRMVETDPKNPDTDGDGICDGPTAVAGVCTAGPDTTPIPTSEDADGDGLPDALDAAPNNADRDGDGLCDGPAAVSGVCSAGEDKNADGVIDPDESDPNEIDTDCDGLVDGDSFGAFTGEQVYGTDPANADSDGDGLLDGQEAGIETAPDPSCQAFAADSDPSTTTDPGDPDSDNDGLPDGVEDANQNGQVDAGELDPNNSSDGDDDPVTQAACQLNSLVEVMQQREWLPDLQVATAIRTPDAFTEQARIANIVSGEGGASIVGIMGFNPAAAVAFLVMTVEPAGAGIAAEESRGQNRLSRAGALSVPITSQFTTWDGYPAILASYEQTASIGVKAQANALVRTYYPNALEMLDESNDVLPTAGFRLQAEYVRRSDNTAVVLVALIPTERYTGSALFTLDDTANGTALAQFKDSVGVQCDRFESNPDAMVDILWAVDNSVSMNNEQAMVAAAGTALEARLNNATIDWRVAVVSSGFFNPRGQDQGCTNLTCGPTLHEQCRAFTDDISVFTSWFTEGETAWIGAGGPCNQPREEIAWGAQLMLTENTGFATYMPQTAIPDPMHLRENVHLVLILMGDADDQHYRNTDPAVGIDEYETFFNSLPVESVTMGGILCPDGSCGEYQCDPHVATNLVNRFGGVNGTLSDINSIEPTINAIVDSVIGAVSPYTLTKAAISSTIRVAVAHNSTLGTCNWDDVPRSRENGFDYDSRSRTISFYGDCRPDPAQTGSRVSVSYRYWIDQSPERDPHEGPCGVCPFCPGISRCDIDICECICDQTMSCGQGFSWDQTACDCLCQPQQLQCSDTRQADTHTCACVCREDCGGCGANFTCQPSLCECLPDGG